MKEQTRDYLLGGVIVRNRITGDKFLAQKSEDPYSSIEEDIDGDGIVDDFITITADEVCLIALPVRFVNGKADHDYSKVSDADFESNYIVTA